MSEEVLEQEIEHEKGLRAARQKISDKLSGKIKGGVSTKVAGGLMKLIENKHRTTAFALAFILAIFSDFSDIATELLGFIIPIVNEIPDTIIDLATGGALTLFFAQIGGGIKIKIWIIQLAATVFELIPFLIINDIFPTYTLGVIYAFHLVNKKAREAEAQLEEAGRGGAMGEDMGGAEE
ncbi:MAG: hypothetical protein AAB949_00010 [Patescibacteria group bacterium]